jgi:transcriptional regulator with XRE-family HTH domain
VLIRAGAASRLGLIQALTAMPDITATLGSRIKALRSAQSLTQSDVAMAVGVSKAAVSQWELNVAAPQGDNLIRLAARLGASPGELLWGDTSQQIARVNEARLSMAISCLESGLGSKYLSLSPGQKAKLLGYLYSRGEPLPRPELIALLGLVA